MSEQNGQYARPEENGCTDDMQLINGVLDILSNDSRIPAEKIATMLNRAPKEIEECIKKLESDNIICFKPTINREKVDQGFIRAIIELKITPQRDMGFEQIAKRIYQYPQVKSLYLMSGTYDLALIIDGHSLKEVALFVAEKLAPMESVVSTATHFVLRAYKDNGFIFDEKQKDIRQVVL